LTVPQTADPTNEFPGTLFFNSNGSVPSVSKSQTPFLLEKGLSQAPKYPSGAYDWYFWTLTDATTYGGYPAMLY